MGTLSHERVGATNWMCKEITGRLELRSLNRYPREEKFARFHLHASLPDGLVLSPPVKISLKHLIMERGIGGQLVQCSITVSVIHGIAAYLLFESS